MTTRTKPRKGRAFQQPGSVSVDDYDNDCDNDYDNDLKPEPFSSPMACGAARTPLPYLASAFP
jgi:hypothetical protein